MKYSLQKSNINDIDRIIRYKEKNICKFAKNLSKKELEDIKKYVYNETLKNINNCFDIVVNKNIVGLVSVVDNEGKKTLEEIYIEKEYRNKGIGSDIIKNTISKNDTLYLYVYKSNAKAISLYKKLGFDIIEETDTRYYMKYVK